MSEDKFIRLPFAYLGVLPFPEACFLAYLDNECRLHSGKVKIIQAAVCERLNITDYQYKKYMNLLFECGCIEKKKTLNGMLVSVKNPLPDLANIAESIRRISTNRLDEYHRNVSANSTESISRIAPNPIHNKRINIEEEVRNARTRVKAPYSGDGILEAWTEHYRAAFGTDYIPDWSSNASDTVTLDKAVEKKMEQYHENYSDLEAKKDFCRRMFDAMLKVADAWQRDHWSLHTVTTQFNQLFNTIINGKANNNNGQRNASTDTEYIKRVMREAGLPVADPCGM